MAVGSEAGDDVCLPWSCFSGYGHPLGYVKAGYRTGGSVALPINPELPVIISAGLEEDSMPTDVPTMNLIGHSNGNPEPAECESARPAYLDIFTDLPSRVVVIDQPRWTAAESSNQTLIVLTRH